MAYDSESRKPPFGMTHQQGYPETAVAEAKRRKQSRQKTQRRSAEERARKMASKSKAKPGGRTMERYKAGEIGRELKPSYYNPKFEQYLNQVKNQMRDTWKQYGYDYDTGKAVSDLEGLPELLESLAAAPIGPKRSAAPEPALPEFNPFAPYPWGPR